MKVTVKLFRLALMLCALCALCVISAAAASYGVGHVDADALRLRATPATDGEILATAPGGTKVVLLEDEVDGWYKVDYKTMIGYMSADWIIAYTSYETDLGYGVVDTDGDPLNLRAEPTTESKILDIIPGYTSMKLLGIKDGWYKVSYMGSTGYVSSDYIRLAKNESGDRNDGNSLEATPAPSYSSGSSNSGSSSSGNSGSSSSSSSGSGYTATYTDTSSASTLGAKVVAIAKAQLGKPYVLGAKGPNAFDCSGFVYYVYSQLGYNLCGGSSTQYRSYGTPVSFSDLQPGDLYFIRNPRYSGGYATSHVGIYIGGGQIIHASTDGAVVISSIYSNGYDTYFVGARRIG